MCVAAPGKIVALDGITATVDYNGNKTKANCGIINAKIGDRVLVHAGLVIQVLSDNEAEEMDKLYKELESL